ncbi:MAG TPA: hypothetical protein DEF34_05895 [Desulfotomaculum sp.]|nr:MAG: hypothetical protein VR67_17245 [Peptococcaceae bacterium BRH_c8a]KJS72760.1 MAG: hypothetical protein JL56_12400 [Desulfotomaculum sp. BICA1-6]HBX23148.1 hypothetical protein [Desulfotomaculum sp.]
MSGFNYAKLWDKIFHPNRAKQEEIQNRLKEMQELSKLATEIGNKQIYKNLQVEMNELFMKYLTYVFFDGLRFIAPHFLLLAIITSKVSFIYLPVNLPLFGNEIGVVLLYPVMAILAHFAYKRFRSKKLQLS